MALFLEGIACEDLDRLAPRDLEGLRYKHSNGPTVCVEVGLTLPAFT